MSGCVMVTGAAKRIGAEIARVLHAAGYNVIVHFRESDQAALVLKDELNELRPRSAELLQADLLEIKRLPELADRAISIWGRVDALINSASAFYPTPLNSTTEQQWDELIGCNLKAPFFLSLALAHDLEQHKGGIVNILDIHALRPLKGFSVYSISKAGMVAMTQSLARELGPSVCVNGVAPGAILWPENKMTEAQREKILAKIALRRIGVPRDIARTVLFLLGSDYITGQIIPVDGGRSLYS